MSEQMEASPSKKASLRDAPELIMMRHHDLTRAVQLWSAAQIKTHLEETVGIRERALAAHWKGSNSHNAWLLAKYSINETDLAQLLQMWSVGYLAYLKPGTPTADGRLRNYFNQRFAELIRSVKRKAQDCAPDVSEHEYDEFLLASVSQSSHEGVAEVEDASFAPRGPAGHKLRLLERLAVLDHPAAVSTHLATDDPDQRTQVSRLAREMQACKAWVGKVGTGECAICVVRRRGQDGAILVPPASVNVRELRAWIEEHLGLARPFTRLLIRSEAAGAPPTRERRHTRSRLAARVLGLASINGNGTLSATSDAYDLLPLPAGSDAERHYFQALVHKSTSLRRTDAAPNFLDFAAPLGAPMPPKKPILVPDATPRTTAPTRSTSYRAIRLEQNGHVFYMFAAPIDELFPHCFVDRSEDNEKGFQRQLAEGRAEEVATYLAQAKQSIPGCIILAAQREAALEYDPETGALSFVRRKDAYSVLDGQHRLWGYYKCAVRHQVPVIVYQGLEPKDEARLFLDINDKHKGVSRAQLLAVKGLAGTESPAETVLRGLFRRLSVDPTSPLRDVLTVSDKVTTGKLNRSSFDYGVSRAMRSETFTGLQDEGQYKLVLNYTKAFYEALADKQRLSRRYYFAAMFELLPEVVVEAKKRHRSAKAEHLLEVVKEIANVAGKVQKDYIDNMRAALRSSTSVSDADV